jgi:hypothetical protein
MTRTNTNIFTIEQFCIQGIGEQGMFTDTSISRAMAINIDALKIS